MTNETCSLGKTKSVKHDISSENIDTFKFLLENIKWDDILPVNSPDNAYETFYIIFSDLYDTAFPKREIEIKSQHLQSRCITRGLQKSSKRKQRLFFLKKKRITENETKYKKYKYLFEKIEKKSKTSYYQRKLKLFEGDIKKTWKIIKEVIARNGGTCGSFPKTLIIDKVEITDTKTIANSFNNFF